MPIKDKKAKGKLIGSGGPWPIVFKGTRGARFSHIFLRQ